MIDYLGKTNQAGGLGRNTNFISTLARSFWAYHAWLAGRGERKLSFPLHFNFFIFLLAESLRAARHHPQPAAEYILLSLAARHAMLEAFVSREQFDQLDFYFPPRSLQKKKKNFARIHAHLLNFLYTNFFPYYYKLFFSLFIYILVKTETKA